ncbi:MAG TPA: nucleotidyltransferase family protein [Jatrophihabitans sp.]|nr:nucleotidyltransferase family protein [Jatrophihabitans sp.]
MICGIVLAAGAGSRLGRPKAEVLLGGRRLLDRAVATMLAGGCDKVLAVVRSEEVSADGASTVVNPNPDDGMGSSLRTGLAAVPEDTDAVVVTLVDLPDVAPGDVRALFGWYRQGASIVVTRRAGVRSHPVLVARRWLADFAASAVGDQGGRDFINGHFDIVEYVDVERPITDIDTPEDLAEAEQRFADKPR